MFAYLAASGLEKRQAETVAGGNLFGIRIPLAAAGYDIVRGPMAFAGMTVSWLGLILVCSGNMERCWLGFALFSLAQLHLARRQVSVTFLTLALLTAAVALSGCLSRLEDPRLATHAWSTCAVCCSLLAIAVDRSGALQRFLRIPQRGAGITFCVHASLFAIAASISAIYVFFDKRRGYCPELTLANHVLREQLGGRRPRFTDDQRGRLAVKGWIVGRRRWASSRAWSRPTRSMVNWSVPGAGLEPARAFRLTTF